MTSGANGEWVRQGTPHDDNADWNEEQSEYGTAVSPTEWDDYSSEQAVPITPPRAQAEGDVGTAETAGSPGSPVEHDHEPVPGQEPQAGEEYRSDTVVPDHRDEPAGDTEHDVSEQSGFISIPQTEAETLASDDLTDERDAETTRPRPIVPEAATSAVAAAPNHAAEDMGVPTDDQPTGEQRHTDAAEYLAVDPVPVVEVDEVSADDRVNAPVDTTVDDAPADVAVEDEPLQADADNELTQQVDVDDVEATQAVPVAAAAVGGSAVAASAHTGSIPDGLYRSAGGEETSVMAQDTYPNQDADVEEERLQAQLEAERQAREQRLGAVPTSSDNAIREDEGTARVSTDRFFPSFGLFMLRIVLAAILGVASYQVLGSGVDATADFLGRTSIPEPRLVAWILGFTLGAMALLLIIGMLQRVVGFLLLAVAVGSLVFIRWGNFDIFTPGVEGFIGDKDLLLAAVGLLLLTIGGGAWGIDGAFRRARATSKAERQG